MSIDSIGRLMVNTTTPDSVSRFTISASSQTDYGISINNTYTAIANSFYAHRYLQDGTHIGGLYWNNSTSSPINYTSLNGMYFRSGNAAAGDVALSITSSGNVGIGVTNPTYKLHIVGGNVYAQNGTIQSYSSVMGSSGTWAVFGSNTGTTPVLINRNADPNGSKDLFINATGNIGIGTTNPLSRLDSRGNILIATNASGNNILSFGNSQAYGPLVGAPDSSHGNSFIVGNASTDPGAPSYISMWTTTGGTVGERLRVSAGGNVGIGTTNPAAKLHVDSGVDSEIVRLTTTNAEAQIRFLHNAGSTYTTTLGSQTLGVNNVGLVFRTGTGSGSNSLVIDVSGNVGIGTATPVKKLQIGSLTGNFSYTSADALGIASSQNPGISVRNTTNTSEFDLEVSSATNGMRMGSSTTHNFNLMTNNELRVTITSTGNVGIGTTDPLTRLDTKGALHVGGGSDGIWLGNIGDNAAYDNVKLYYTGYNSGSPRIYLTPRTQPGSGTVNTYLHLLSANTGNGGNNTMGLLVDGNVGIGTTNPLTKLDVRGVITAGSDASTTGSEILRGSYSAGALTVIGTEFSSGGPVIGYGVKPSTTSAGSFLSSTSVSIGRSAYVADASSQRWYFGSTQTVAENSAVTMSEVMRLTSSGNVGIGTINPTTKFQVVGGIIEARSSNAQISNASANGSVVLRELGGSTANNSVEVHIRPSSGKSGYLTFTEDTIADRWSIGVQNGDSALRFINGTPSGGTEVVKFTGASNVGIGTTNPTTKLHVEGTGQFVATSSSSATSTVTAVYANTPLQTVSAFFGRNTSVTGLTGDQYSTSIRFNGAAVAWGDIAYYPNQGGKGHFRFSLASNSVETFPNAKVGVGSLYSAGPVGIGTTNPTQNLQVLGNEAAAGKINAVGVTYSSGSFLNAFTTVGANDLGFSGFIASQALQTNRLYIGVHSPGGVNESFIGTPDNNAFTLWTNATQRMTISSSGNVGVGVNSPIEKLEVNGNLKVFLDGINQKNVARIVELGYSGITGAKNWALRGTYQHASGVSINADGGDLDLIKSLNGNTVLATKTDGTALGNVLIGSQTASAHGTLQVNGNIGLLGTRTIRSASDGDDNTLTFIGTRLAIGSANSLAYGYADGALISSISNGDTLVLLDAGRASATSRFRISNSTSSNVQIRLYNASETTFIANSGGSVGIGTATAYTVGATSAHKLTITASDILACGPTSSNMFYIRNQGLSGEFALQTVSAGTNGGNFQLQPYGGNVGIGTTNPGAKLHVHGSGDTSAIFKSTAAGAEVSLDAANGYAALRIFASGTETWRIGNIGQSSSFQIHQLGTGDRLTISNTGNVGIGTTNPLAKLEVTGGTIIKSGNLLVTSQDFSGLVVGRRTYTLVNSFTANPQTKNIDISISDSGSIAIEVYACGEFNNGNYMGAIKTVYSLGYNTSGTSIYTPTTPTQIYSLGNTGSVFSFGNASKPNNTTLRIPVNYTGVASNEAFYIVLEIFGKGVNSITGVTFN